jgi:hypothetical protein
MKVIDKLHEQDLKIIKVLYDDWKSTMNGSIKFEAKSCSIDTLLNATGMTKPQAGSYLKNLESFDFIEYDKDSVKLLPSGINYALGHFDRIK